MIIPRIIWPQTEPPQLRRDLERLNDALVWYTKIPQYNDNAAAVAAGLQPGELYYTALGAVMVVV